MQQNRCINRCTGTILQASPENIQMLNFCFSIHQVILTNFPTLLFVIWYIYPPTTSLILTVVDAATKEEVDG